MRRFFCRLGSIANPLYRISLEQVKFSNYNNNRFQEEKNPMYRRSILRPSVSRSINWEKDRFSFVYEELKRV